MLCRHKCVHC